MKKGPSILPGIRAEDERQQTVFILFSHRIFIHRMMDEPNSISAAAFCEYEQELQEVEHRPTHSHCSWALSSHTAASISFRISIILTDFPFQKYDLHYAGCYLFANRLYPNTVFHLVSQLNGIWNWQVNGFIFHSKWNFHKKKRIPLMCATSSKIWMWVVVTSSFDTFALVYLVTEQCPYID